METDQLKKIIVRRLMGELSEEENHLLEQWLAASANNRKLMEKLTSEVFLRKAVGDRNKELYQQEWKKLETRTTGKRKRIIGMRWLRVAAVLLVGISGLSVWLLQRSAVREEFLPVARQIQAGSSKAVVELAGGEQFRFTKDTVFRFENQEIQLSNRQDTLNLISRRVVGEGNKEFHTIRIPWGGEYIARLEDGSVVHLNAGSELKVPVNFGVDSRNVWLKGEAFFDVTPDKTKVFTVHTEKADISVLGTEFDVRAYEDEQMVTTLVEGAVEVVSGKASDRLKPGYQARIAERGKIATEKVDVYPFIAWKTGRMVFEDTPLEQIMTELQRWYDFEIFYANPGVKEMRFTMDILKYDDISKVLNLMEKMQKVTFTQKGRTVVLNGR